MLISSRKSALTWEMRSRIRAGWRRRPPATKKVAEAHGLELILKGMRERCKDDNQLLAEASTIFDDLYLTYTQEENKDEQ